MKTIKRALENLAKAKTGLSRKSAAVRWALVALGSWRFWCGAAMAAGVSFVLYTTTHADTGDAGSHAYHKLLADPTDPAVRIMTFNRIKTSMEGPVDYDNFTGSTTGTKTNRNWWDMLNDDAVKLTGYNLQKGTHFTCHAKGNEGPVLWEFINCRGGNLNPTSTGGKPKDYQNLLPWSNEGYSFKSRTSTANQTTAGTLVMQNTLEAEVVSSVLQDGIGTIYFDAVNGFDQYKFGKLQVEVAYGVWKTNVTGKIEKEEGQRKVPDDLERAADGSFVPPDAAHADEHHTVDEGATTKTVETNANARIAWVPVKLTGHWWCNGSEGTAPTNTIAALKMPEVGKTTDHFANFYRFWAPVQDERINPELAPYCGNPMRFRIRRMDDPQKEVGIDPGLDGENFASSSTYAPRNGLLILDNIIASYPAMSACAIPGGTYVGGGSRRNVIGWTGAVSTRFPIAGEEGLRATADLQLTTNAPPGVTSDWIAGLTAKMQWRWRYGGNVSGGWTVHPLKVDETTGDRFVSAEPFDLPSAPGDIEFRYETVVDAPYYGYVDYSGKAVGTPGYIERISATTSRFNPDACGQKQDDGTSVPDPLPSGGEDFFFRLREGKSDQLEYVLEVRVKGETEARVRAPCWLVTNNVWKTYLKTTTNEIAQADIKSTLPRGTYEFRFAAVNPEGAFVSAPVDRIPATSVRLNRTAGEDWATLAVDAATDALMFQLTEDPDTPDELTFTAVHASFQDFNSWHDAVTGDGLYTGAFFEGRGKQSGSSPDARDYPDEVSGWHETAAGSVGYWTEAFKLTGTAKPTDGYDGHTAYEPFVSSATPNGWEAAGGMWVCSKWRESAAGGDMALQLAADGSLRYVNTSEMPHGIDNVVCRARIAQAADFGDFAIYDAGDAEDNRNYIVSMRAAMRLNKTADDFDGNGTISIIGYYRSGKGCYEMRAERIATDTVRINLYKWTFDGGKKAKATHLGYYNSTRTMAQCRMLCNASSIPTATSTGSYYGELFMRCQTSADEKTVTITAGIMNNSSKKISDSCSNSAHYYFVYKDVSDSRITYGKCGFDALNCPAQIIDYAKYPDGNGGTFPTVSTNPYDPSGKAISDANFKCGSATVVYGTTADPDKGRQSLFIRTTEGGKEYYRDWSYRFDKFAVKLDFASTYRGLLANPPSGTMELHVTAGGKETFAASTPLSGFTYQTVTNAVRNAANSLMELRTAKGSDDIVIDTVSFGQWGAGSYDDSDNEDFGVEKLPAAGCPTNFVYVNGLVTVNGDAHAVVLQPLRAMALASGDRLLSVRAPLMDGQAGRGIGLGSISYAYRDADARCRVFVQYRDDTVGTEDLASRTRTAAGWKTVATNDFSQMSAAERKGDVISTYVGAHAATGMMRIIVDPQVVADAQDPAKNPTGDPDYGKITVTRVTASDEPPLFGLFWWGWNLRATDDPDEIALYDADGGLAMALNNSVTADTEPWGADETDDQRKKRFQLHVPFVESPTFFTNLVNEVSFRARKMTPTDLPTEVTILGAKDAEVSLDAEWKPLKTIVVDSPSFATYSYKAKSTDGYRSFRLAVIGVKDVAVNYEDATLPDGTPAKKIPAAQRVLIDEVSVSEGVYGDVGFLNVGAFRTPLDKHVYVDPETNLFAIAQQPMCAESWTVQCEVRATQLKDEILLDDETAVTFHWYRGDKWGYEKWKDDPTAKAAPLARIKGLDGFVYRGSYSEAGAAIVEPIFDSGAVVQFMLVARYKNADGTWADPRPLRAGEWKKPDWYRGVDYNATRGGFAAYTILDTVAYGYAWINEINFYDGPTSSGNTAWTNQYVEVAAPAEAKLDRWKLQFITGGLSDSDAFYTNTVATFLSYADGTPGVIPAQKPENKHLDVPSGYVFLTACSPSTQQYNPGLKAQRYVDGTWAVGDDFYAYQEQLKSDGTVSGGYPIGVRLVRPSGIIEDEAVVIGTNIYARLGEWEAAQHSPTNFVNRLRQAEKDDGWYFVGEDDGSKPAFGRSVTNQFASSEGDWAYWPQTPGRINANGAKTQYIASDHPRPYATMLILYANLENGHIAQSYGEHTNATENLVLYIPKELPNGTNIVYDVGDWHEIESITETVSGKEPKVSHVGERGHVVCTVAVNETNDTVRLVASTRVRSDLVDEYGLDPAKNNYANAVVSWLEGNATLRDGGTGFKNPGGMIELARLEGLDGVDRGEMSLTDMYWFDMDPTWAGQVFRMGMIEAPSQKPSGGSLPYADGAVTNLVMQVFMMVSNRVDDTFVPYAPYTLNGRKPGSSSAVDSSGWDSETFKITGIVNNGKSAVIPKTAEWLPLRYFVFGPNSFKNFRSTIEIVDPFSPASPAYYQGWDVLKGKPAFFSFSIDTRTAPISPEILDWDSTLSK